MVATVIRSSSYSKMVCHAAQRGNGPCVSPDRARTPGENRWGRVLLGECSCEVVAFYGYVGHLVGLRHTQQIQAHVCAGQGSTPIELHRGGCRVERVAARGHGFEVSCGTQLDLATSVRVCPGQGSTSPKEHH